MAQLQMFPGIDAIGAGVLYVDGFENCRAVVFSLMAFRVQVLISSTAGMQRPHSVLVGLLRWVTCDNAATV